MLLCFLRVTTHFFVEAQGFIVFFEEKRVEQFVFYVLAFVGRRKAIRGEAGGLAGPI